MEEGDAVWHLTRTDLRRHASIQRMFSGVIAFLVAVMYAIAALIESHKLIAQITFNATTAALLPAMLVVVLVAMMLFTVAFIVYFNSLLLARREAEFGLYRRLGMPAWRLGASLSLEMAYSVVIGLGWGLMGGILLSKLLAMILLRLVDVAKPVGVLISPVAIAEVVGFMGLVVLLLAALRLLAVQGKELTHYWQPAHQTVLPPRRGWLAWLGALGALVLVIAADIVLLQLFTWTGRFARWFGDFVGVSMLLGLVIGAALLGSYLVYAYLLPLVLGGLAKRRSAQLATRYLTLTYLTQRLRKNAQSLWLTTWLTTATLVMLGSAAMLFQFGQAAVNQDIAQPVLTTAAAQQEVSVLVGEDARSIDLDTKLAAGQVKLRMRTADLSDQRGLYQVIALSDYRRIAKVQPMLPKIQLTGNQALMLTVDQTYYQAQAFGRWSNRGRQLTLTQTKTRFAIQQISNVFPLGSAGYFDRGLVVTDAAYQKLQAPVDSLHGYWPKAATAKLANQLAALEQTEYAGISREVLAGQRPVIISARSQNESLARRGVNLQAPARHEMRVVFGCLLFTMMLLGVVFMVATASILLLKQLAAAHGSRADRRLLNRLGLPQAALRHIETRQVLAVFGIPLVVGSINAGIGLALIAGLLSATIGSSVALAFGGYLLVYLIFAAVTAGRINRE